MRMKSNTHPGKVIISKKCLQKDGKLLFQMKLKTELGQLLPIQKACPCGVTAAVDFPELWNIVVLFFFIHPIAGWTWHAKTQKQWHTITAIPHTFSHCCAPRQRGPGTGYSGVCKQRSPRASQVYGGLGGSACTFAEEAKNMSLENQSSFREAEIFVLSKTPTKIYYRIIRKKDEYEDT